MDKALTWFIGLWIGLVVLLNVLALIGFFIAAPSASAAIAKIAEIYSPLNGWNWLAEVVSLLPAAGALTWRNRRRALQPRESQNK
jgi:membrane protein implicated in regulation of membrane protease activity